MSASFELNEYSAADLEQQLEKPLQEALGTAYTVVYWATTAHQHGIAILLDKTREQASIELSPSLPIEQMAQRFVARYLAAR